MKVHVIMLNDSSEFVFVGSKDDAEQKLIKLSEDYYFNNRNAFPTLASYKSRCRWYVRTVDSNLQGNLLNGFNGKGVIGVECVVMPVEPTKEMLRAAIISENGNAIYKAVSSKVIDVEEDRLRDSYKAMINVVLSR